MAGYGKLVQPYHPCLINGMKVGKGKDGASFVEFNCWYMFYLLEQKITLYFSLYNGSTYVFSENI